MPSPKPEPKPSLALAVFGRLTFIVALALGLAIGFAIVPLSSNMLHGAMVTFGALCLMAAMALRAGRADRKIDDLQQKLLDERSYHAFVDGAVEGFFRTTREGRYLIANPALARMYGYDSPEQLRDELTDIGGSLYVSPERRDEFLARMKSERMVRDFVSQIRRRDGSLIWISENARAVTDDDDQFLFYEGTVEDITEKRESEETMRRALHETQEAMRAKSAFLAAISHELKTPLNAVIGFSEMMRNELFGPIGNPRYKSYVEDVNENGRRLLVMINDILDLSRIEGRLMDLDEQSVSVPDAIASARDVVAESKKNAPDMFVDASGDTPPLRADPKRLSQILVHVLSNAAKFTKKEGRIDIRGKVAADGGIVIAIRDTGIGMAPELIKTALEPFKQLDGRLERRFEGLGLGLPLASALMRLHGGALAIQSSPGQGTTVTLTFPSDRTVRIAEVPAA